MIRKKIRNLMAMATVMTLSSNIGIGGIPVRAASLEVNSENILEQAGISYSSDYTKAINVINGGSQSTQVGGVRANIYKNKLDGTDCAEITAIPSDMKEIPTTLTSSDAKGNITTYKVISVTSAVCNTIATKNNGDLKIPSGIVNINNNATITAKKVTIPATMEAIPERLFTDSKTLTSITLSQDVKSVGDYAFASTSITQIKIPANCTLGKNVFYDCSKLYDVTLPTTQNDIPEGTFSNCTSLRSLYIPANISTIGKDAFYKSAINESKDFKGTLLGYLDLSSITNIKTSAFSSCNNISTVKFGNGINEIGEDAFENSKVSSIEIPTGASITGFGANAFAGTLITGFNIPNKVKSLNDNTFANCTELTTVNFPEGFESIGYGCFNNCEKLSKLDFPATLKKINSYSFEGAGIKAAVVGTEPGIDLTIKTIPEIENTLSSKKFNFGGAIKSITLRNEEGVEPITVIPDNFFSDNKNLTEVILNEGLENIGDSAFASCTRLKNIKLPSTVKTIGNNAFDGDILLTKVEQVPATKIDGSEFYRLSTLGDSTFKNCTSLKEMELHEGIIAIGDSCFNGCGLEKLTIPSSMKKLGNYALANNTVLKDVVLTNGLENIGDYCFENDKNLKLSVVVDGKVQEGNYIPGTVKVIGVDPFKGANIPDYFSDNCEFEVLNKDDGTEYGKDEKKNIIVKKYFGTDTTTDFAALAKDYVIVSISDGAFANNAQVTTAVIPDTVKDFGNGVFENCTALKNVTIPSTILELKENTFKGCSNLESVNFQTKNVDIKDLSEEDYKKYVKTDEKGNPKFDKFTVGTRIIDAGAFDGCAKLERIFFPTTLEVIKTGAIRECPLLHSINFSTSSYDYEQNFTKIESEAFTNCPILGYSTTDVKEDSVRYPLVLPDSVTVENKAFPIETILQNKGFQYQLTDNGVDIVKCYGYNYTSIEGKVDASQNEMTKVIEVPSSLNGRNVEYIGKDAFNNGTANSITESIVLNDGIKGIKGHAFYNCSKLKSIKLCDTLVSIEDYAFGGTNLKTVELPTKVVGVSSRAFKDSNIETIKSGNYTYKMLFTGAVNDEFQGVEITGHNGGQDASVTVPATLNGFKVVGIGTGAFKDDDILTTLSISEGIKYISEGAVNNCKKLSTFNNASTCSVNGKAFIDTAIESHYDNGIEYKVVGDSVIITKYTGNATILNIPKEYDGKKVTTIADGAFSNCTNLVSVNMEEGLTTIGNNAFNGCSLLSNISIPYTVTTIGTGAFASCSQLQTIVLPNITTIPDNLFKGCSKLQTIILPNVTTIIGIDAFNGCSKLSGVTIPEAVKVIGKGAFVGTGIGTISIPHEQGVVSLEGAFSEGVKILYKTVVKQYTVIFKDYDGRVLSSQVVKEGDSAVEPTPYPSREGYVFKGWDKGYNNISANTEITATYEEKPKEEEKQYTVTFKNWDGKVLKTEKVVEGGKATAPENPTRDGYTFAGWGKDFSNIKGDMELVAVFNPITADATSTLPLVGTVITALAGVFSFKRKRK